MEGFSQSKPRLKPTTVLYLNAWISLISLIRLLRFPANGLEYLKVFNNLVQLLWVLGNKVSSTAHCGLLYNYMNICFIFEFKNLTILTLYLSPNIDQHLISPLNIHQYIIKHSCHENKWNDKKVLSPSGYCKAYMVTSEENMHVDLLLEFTCDELAAAFWSVVMMSLIALDQCSGIELRANAPSWEKRERLLILKAPIVISINFLLITSVHYNT